MSPGRAPKRRTWLLLAGLASVLVLAGGLRLVVRARLGDALRHAAERGDTERVRFLLDHWADPNARLPRGHATTPLHFAALRGHAEVARLLLDHGADVNAKASCDFTALHLAAENGDVATVRLLLDRGADLNAIDLDSRTNALGFALECQNWEAAKLLILAGSDVNIPAEPGLMPLDIAAGHDDVVALLLQRGARHSKGWVQPPARSRR